MNLSPFLLRFIVRNLKIMSKKNVGGFKLHTPILIVAVIIFFTISSLVYLRKANSQYNLLLQLQNDVQNIQHQYFLLNTSVYNQVHGNMRTKSNNVLPLPSVRIFGSDENRASKFRKFYGGKGDKTHLGGFINFDRMDISNNTFNYMMVCE